MARNLIEALLNGNLVTSQARAYNSTLVGENAVESTRSGKISLLPAVCLHRTRLANGSQSAGEQVDYVAVACRSFHGDKEPEREREPSRAEFGSCSGYACLILDLD